MHFVCFFLGHPQGLCVVGNTLPSPKQIKILCGTSRASLKKARTFLLRGRGSRAEGLCRALPWHTRARHSPALRLGHKRGDPGLCSNLRAGLCRARPGHRLVSQPHSRTVWRASPPERARHQPTMALRRGTSSGTCITAPEQGWYLLLS